MKKWEFPSQKSLGLNPWMPLVKIWISVYWIFYKWVRNSTFHLSEVATDVILLLLHPRNFKTNILHGSVQFSSSVVSDSLQPRKLQQASLCITNSQSSLRLMSIESVMPSSHLILCRPFSSCPQSLPSSESSPMSQHFPWGGQSTGVSALASFLPKKSQGWSPSEWTGWISLQFKGPSRVFSNTTVQKHQFFSAQPSSQSNSHIHTWPQEKPQPWLDGPLLAK